MPSLHWQLKFGVGCLHIPTFTFQLLRSRLVFFIRCIRQSRTATFQQRAQLWFPEDAGNDEHERQVFTKPHDTVLKVCLCSVAHAPCQCVFQSSSKLFGFFKFARHYAPGPCQLYKQQTKNAAATTNDYTKMQKATEANSRRQRVGSGICEIVSVSR